MKLIDLSHPLSEDTPLFPGDAPFSLTPYKSIAADGYNACLLSTGLHAGTHVDLPRHWLPDGRLAADIPPERFYGRGVLLDARGEARIGWREEYRTRVSRGDVVLLYTGFDSLFYTDPERYFHDYPTLTEGLCDFFCRTGIGLLGMDTPSPDFSPYALHSKLLSHEIFLLENLTGLHALLHRPRFTVLAPPLPLAAEASPVRAIALIEETESE